MTIKEVEDRTGLARSNIRFYEKEKLIAPARNDRNGYRDYSEKDVENIKKIAYLRTLGLPVEEIRSLISEKITLKEAIEKQKEVLEGQITDLKLAKVMCEKMLEAGSLSYEELQIEQYVTNVQDYWSDNRPVFKLDSVSFLYLWGSLLTWGVITVLCLLTAVLTYARLPLEIPVQWKAGAASSLVDKKFIFAYPIICIGIRYLLRPCIRVKLQMGGHYGEMITEYLTNYLCFLALSAEVFSILFLYGIVKNIVVVLLADTVVLIGLLAAGMSGMKAKRGNESF